MPVESLITDNHREYPADTAFTVSSKVIGRPGMQFGNDDRGIGVKMSAERWTTTIRLDTVNALANALLTVAMSGGDFSQAQSIAIEQQGRLTLMPEGAYFVLRSFSVDYDDESAFIPMTAQRYADLLLDVLAARASLLQHY